jgi:serine/threonine protein kinase
VFAALRITNEVTRFTTPLARFAVGRLTDATGTRRVFVKRPNAADELVRERFLHEIRLVDALRHPNLSAIVSSGEDERSPFLAFEFLETTDLADIWWRCHVGRIPIPMEMSVFIIGEVLRALDYVHDRFRYPEV